MRYLPQLKSRVSRRIFFAVFLCAFIPIVALIALTLQSARSNLEVDTARRLHHAGKNIGMAIVAELVSIDKAMRQVATLYTVPDAGLEMEGNEGLFAADILERFWILTENGEISTSAPKFSNEIKNRLSRGLPQLVIERRKQQLMIYLWSPSSDANGQPVAVVGVINHSYLEEYAHNFLPFNSYLSILDNSWQPLLGDETATNIGLELFHAKNSGGHQYAEVEDRNEVWIVGRWNLFLHAAFNSPDWNILVREPKDAIFANLYRFGQDAGLTGVIAFWIILLTSSILVRKTLQPLQQLKEATQEIGRGHFTCQLQLDSRDEFEDLSLSFNQMTAKIQHQLSQQKNMGQAVRQILGANEEEEILTNFLRNFSIFEAADSLSLALINDPVDVFTTDWLIASKENDDIEYLSEVSISANEIDTLIKAEEMYAVQENSLPSLLKPLTKRGGQLFSLFSTEYKPGMFAIACLEHAGQQVEKSDTLMARQLIDQLGVALSRAEMVKKLDDLNLGILTALARTVDANSRWTLGHSERVTQYSLMIANALELSDLECQDLHRAGLLHDLGKIAVPTEILNKPGSLTEEEFETIKTHPVEAARIIEPIQVFDSIRPIVRQHHERWDGGGYPDQLKGTEIHLGARILAVADVYDALYSERPYRAGWSKDKALDYLKQKSGIAFDPEVVEAFDRALHCEEYQLAAGQT